MEDEHQTTLKKKIQILFQLGKWPDVVKLCESYGEKYGKDMEIDMIRFKSERHLGISAPTLKSRPRRAKKSEKVKASVLDTRSHGCRRQRFACLAVDSPAEEAESDDGISPTAADEMPAAREEK